MPTAATTRQLALVASTGTTVMLLVVALVALGLAMIALTVWLVRSTRTDHVALGPLEVMGERSFRRAGADGRADRLGAARPTRSPSAPPATAVEPDPPTQRPVGPADGDDLPPPESADLRRPPDGAPVTPGAPPPGEDEAR